MPSSLACAAERWCASSITKCSVCSPATVASETCTRPVAPISSMDMAPAMPLPHMSKWNLTVPVRRRKGLQEVYCLTALLPYHCLTTALLLPYYSPMIPPMTRPLCTPIRAPTLSPSEADFAATAAIISRASCTIVSSGSEHGESAPAQTT